MLTRYFALLMGVSFVVAGIGGFIPGLTTEIAADALPLSISANYGYLWGLFPVNLLHTLYHFAVGVWGLWAYRSFAAARLYARALGITLTVFTVFGLLPMLNTTFGLLPLYGHDIWLHGAEAAAALFVGFFLRADQVAAVDRTA